MKLLFVDDERQVLRGLTRMIECWEHDWEIATAESGCEALSLMSKTPYDVVVTDMRMPGMDGAVLLDEIAALHPEAVRIVLSGETGRTPDFKAIPPVHQFLSKPCPASQLEDTLSRASLLRGMLEHPNLHALVARISSLPSVPSLYNELLDEIESPNGTTARVGEIISRDPSIAAKFMQLTNSALFGLRQPVTSPTQAVSLLGMEQIKSLVLANKVVSRSDDKDSTALDLIMDHSLQVGLMARAIAHHEQAEDHQFNEAFTGGLLHDIGKIVLLEAAPEKAEEAAKLAQDQGIELWEAEKKTLGAPHDILGAHLLALWGLPQGIVDAVAAHHQHIPLDEGAFSTKAAVAAANLAVGARDIPRRDARLMHSLQRQGLLSQFERWRQCGLLKLPID